MSRARRGPARRLLACIALLVASCTTGSKAGPVVPSPSGHTSAGARPNLVFVLTADLDWNLVGYMPHVRQLQDRGVTFSNSIVSDSLCGPSRASMFSGRFPHDTHVFTNEAPDGGYQVFRDAGGEGDTFATGLWGTAPP